MITATQAYALAILDRTPIDHRKEIIEYLCNGLDALGNPTSETDKLRSFLFTTINSGDHNGMDYCR